MRRFLALFMVLLLAARGLLGDAMATGLTAPHGAGANGTLAVAALAADMHAAHDMHAGHAVHEDMQVAQDAEHCSRTEADSSQGCASHSGHSCSACGICHSALADPALPELPGLAPEAGLNATAHTRFASAAPEQVTKPPIS
ncbi:hypothetical protein GCM10010975_15160 [Comamonas phosphati]|nr:hypothetical protein GCM10010975_15160 [Comamonas phosphati]